MIQGRTRKAGRCLRVFALAVFAVALARGDEPGTWQPPEPIFTEVAAEVGLDFEHLAGRSADYYFPEIVGSGVALFDYDSDGDLDVYLVQSGRIGPGDSAAEAAVSDRLFRNDLTVDKDGGRQLRFVDVTEEAGIEARGYGMGVAAADYNNDGHVDLYVTNFGPNQMLQNNGDHTFTDVTAVSRAGDPGWGTSASFLDYNRDGWLDLYVANYVHFDIQRNTECTGYTGGREYCGPSSHDPQPDRLFRNQGDGTFVDVSSTSGILSALGAGLGVVAVDFNDDDWPDIYVANDQTPNFLWMNQGDGTFKDSALLSGVSVNGSGAAEASMGVDAGDVDNDGDYDLFLTHLDGETNTLYVSDVGAFFSDRSRIAGLAIPSLPFTGFGAGWIDLNNDGWLDLVTVNGAVQQSAQSVDSEDQDPYRQSNQLFQNRDGRSFRDVSAWGGQGIIAAETSRGAAFGDLDNDGDRDVVVQNNDGPVRLLRNDIGHRNQWIGFRLVDPAKKRDVLGARVTVVTASGRTLHQHSRTDGSYASASDPRVLLGLGEEIGIEEVQVRWPEGDKEIFGPYTARAYHELSRGSGRKPPPAELAPGSP